MTISSALAEIATFWHYEPLPFKGSGDDHIARLSGEFSIRLPDELETYIREYAPTDDCYFDTIGNPVRIYGRDNLKREQDGYNFNRLSGKTIDG